MNLINELESFYNKELSQLVRKIYQSELSKLQGKEAHILVNCLKKYPAKMGFFPSIDQLKELAGIPQENAQAYQYHAALPSEEMKMTEEQRLENIKRLNNLIKNIGKI
jgi:hypothetical protein